MNKLTESDLKWQQKTFFWEIWAKLVFLQLLQSKTGLVLELRIKMRVRVRIEWLDRWNSTKMIIKRGCRAQRDHMSYSRWEVNGFTEFKEGRGPCTNETQQHFNSSHTFQKGLQNTGLRRLPWSEITDWLQVLKNKDIKGNRFQRECTKMAPIKWEGETERIER